MTVPKDKWVSWVLFLLLSLIWGSSFILMKKGMYASNNEPTLSAFQVAALRMATAGLVLLPIALKRIYALPRIKIYTIALSGLLGSFIPAFLFCVAETRIDSSLAGFMNALTPISTLAVGLLFFKAPVQQNKITAVLIAFSGMLLLFFSNRHQNYEHAAYASLVVIATLCYAVNVHMASRYLHHIPSSSIAAIAFASLIAPAGLVLLMTGFFNQPFTADHWVSVGSSTLLGIIGTAIASILFYMLMKKSGVLFSSMVTYGIPFVALGWGLLAGEQVQLLQLVGLSIILTGVFLANR